MQYNNIKTMNRTRVELLPRDLVSNVFSKIHWKMSSLLLAVLVSALAVVYATNETRMNYSNLQAAEGQNNQLQVLHNRLLLEESAMSSQAYIQQVAQQRLHMILPGNQNTVVVSADEKD